MNYLSFVIKEVNKTHPHLGEPLAMAMLAVKASKLLLFVAPHGCGKSRITSFIATQAPEVFLRDAISVAGLGNLQGELTGFTGALIIDDLSKGGTTYAQIKTVTTLAELVYSHYCARDMADSHYSITDFYGSAIANIQPILLRDVIKSPEWEASMMDKSIRYYHLYRPLNPNPFPPEIQLDFGIDYKLTDIPKLKGKLANSLFYIAESQWGLARMKEHLSDLLRASAALDKRRKVNISDYNLLLKILKPLKLERLVSDKTDLEGERYLNNNQLALLTEFATYGQFTLKQLAKDYQMSQSKCYTIMNKYANDWKVVSKTPTTYAPSEDLRKILREVGI